MKKVKLLIVALSVMGLNSVSQTKTFVGTIEDYTCGDDRCSFGIKKDKDKFFDENITLEYVNGKAKINPEAQDLVIPDPQSSDSEILNPKYVGKKATVTCTLKNKIYYVNSITFSKTGASNKAGSTKK